MNFPHRNFAGMRIEIGVDEGYEKSSLSPPCLVDTSNIDYHRAKLTLTVSINIYLCKIVKLQIGKVKKPIKKKNGQIAKTTPK